MSTPPPLGSAQGAHALLVEQQGMTDPVAIEIARLLGNGLEQEGLIAALATKFPHLRPAGLDEALRDVIALQNLVAAELAECQRELTQLKVQLQGHKNLTYLSQQLARKVETELVGGAEANQCGTSI